VVSLTPSATENAFALGFGGRLAGVTTGCDRPAAARALPKIGGAVPDLERVLALRPDLVIGDRRVSGRHLDRARAFGLPVWAASASSFDGLLEDLESLARTLGDAERGRAMAADLRIRRDRLRSDAAGRPAPRVHFEYWPDPLWTAGRGTLLEEAITLAGGRNLASELREGWGPVSWEAVLAADPDAVVIAHGDRAACARRPGWTALRAAREGRVFEVERDAFVRPTPRMLEGIESLSGALREPR
jgi:iron complex transport system substrate-binding protein